MNNLRKVKQESQKPALREVFQSPNVQKMLIETVGKNKDNFVANVLSVTSNNLKLKECDSMTIISAALVAENLKLSLSPQLGYAYLVPFEDNKNKRKVATFVLGYRGYIQLAQRSGQYRSIRVSEVKEGEKISYNPFTGIGEFKYIEDEETREKLKTIGYYFHFELLNGFVFDDYWSIEKMRRHALKYSAGYRSDVKNGTAYTFWTQDFDGQAKKTMIRLGLSKWGIMSIEMEKAYNKDSEAMKDSGEYDDEKVVNLDEEQYEVQEKVSEEETKTTEQKTKSSKKKVEEIAEAEVENNVVPEEKTVETEYSEYDDFFNNN